MRTRLPSHHLRAAKAALGHLSALAQPRDHHQGWLAIWAPDGIRVSYLDETGFPRTAELDNPTAHQALAWQAQIQPLSEAMGALYEALAKAPGTSHLFGPRQNTISLAIRGHSSHKVGLEWGSFEVTPYNRSAPPSLFPCSLRAAGDALDAAVLTEGPPTPHTLASSQPPGTVGAWYIGPIAAPTSTLRALLPLVGGPTKTQIWKLDQGTDA